MYYIHCLITTYILLTSPYTLHILPTHVSYRAYTTHCIACPYTILYPSIYIYILPKSLNTLHILPYKLDIKHLQLHKHCPCRTVVVGNLPQGHRGEGGTIWLGAVVILYKFSAPSGADIFIHTINIYIYILYYVYIYISVSIYIYIYYLYQCLSIYIYLYNIYIYLSI